MSFSLIVYAGRRLPLHGISNKISNAHDVDNHVNARAFVFMTRFLLREPVSTSLQNALLRRCVP
jgi:hypothetical protein